MLKAKYILAIGSAFTMVYAASEKPNNERIERALNMNQSEKSFYRERWVNSAQPTLDGFQIKLRMMRDLMGRKEKPLENKLTSK